MKLTIFSVRYNLGLRFLGLHWHNFGYVTFNTKLNKPIDKIFASVIRKRVNIGNLLSSMKQKEYRQKQNL